MLFKRRRDDLCVFDYLMEERYVIEKYKIPIICMFNDPSIENLADFVYDENPDSRQITYLYLNTKGVGYFGFVDKSIGYIPIGKDIDWISINPLELELSHLQKIAIEKKNKTSDFEALDKNDEKYKFAEQMLSILYHKVSWASYMSPTFRFKGFTMCGVYVRRALLIDYSDEVEKNRSLDQEPEFLKGVPMGNIRAVIQ